MFTQNTFTKYHLMRINALISYRCVNMNIVIRYQCVRQKKKNKKKEEEDRINPVSLYSTKHLSSCHAMSMNTSSSYQNMARTHLVIA